MFETKFKKLNKVIDILKNQSKSTNGLCILYTYIFIPLPICDSFFLYIYFFTGN